MTARLKVVVISTLHDLTKLRNLLVQEEQRQTAALDAIPKPAPDAAKADRLAYYPHTWPVRATIQLRRRFDEAIAARAASKDLLGPDKT